MARFLWVCLGSALGGGARYCVSIGVARWISPSFPLATLLVNFVGSFLIGFIMRVALTSTTISPTARLFLTTGVMGGLTTYSTFNYETLELLRGGDWGTGLVNLGLTVGGCLLAGAGGLLAGAALVSP